MTARRFDGRPIDRDDETGPPPAASDPTPIGDALDQLVRHLGAPPVSVLAQLRDRWPDIVGPALSATSRPVELLDGVLTVVCDDGAHAAQIGWMDAQIRQRFDEVFTPGLLRRVAVRVEPKTG